MPRSCVPTAAPPRQPCRPAAGADLPILKKAEAAPTSGQKKKKKIPHIQVSYNYSHHYFPHVVVSQPKIGI